MKREIKFRAWNKAHKRFAPEKDDYTITMNGVVKEYPPDDLTWNEWEDARDIVIMQFTGLLDKNGVEIYEGDLIKKSTGGIIYTVGFSEGSFKLEHKDHCKSNVSSWKESELAIIGNIYENPELLEQQ